MYPHWHPVRGHFLNCHVPARTHAHMHDCVRPQAAVLAGPAATGPRPGCQLFISAGDRAGVVLKGRFDPASLTDAQLGTGNLLRRWPGQTFWAKAGSSSTAAHFSYWAEQGRVNIKHGQGMT